MIPSGQKGLTAPFLPLTLTLIAGILIGEHIPLSIFLIAVSALILLSVLLCRRKAIIAQLLALAILFALGAFLIHLSLHPRLPPHHISNIPDRHTVMLRGTIYRPPQREETKTVAYLMAEEISHGHTMTLATGRVRITIRNPAVPLRYGYQVRLNTKIYHPHNFHNPGSFDYEGYLRRKGVLVTGYVRDRDSIEIVSTKRGNFLLRRFDRWRARIEHFFNENTSPPGRGMLKALLIALLEPTEALQKIEREMDFTQRLAIMEALKALPWSAVWDYYCLQKNVPTEHDWFGRVRQYEHEVLSRRT